MTYGPFLSRRTLLTAAGAVGIAGALPAPRALAPGIAALSPVTPDRRAFAADEHLYAPYLVSLAAMTGDIRTGAPNAGFLGGAWWRKPSEPYNTPWPPPASHGVIPARPMCCSRTRSCCPPGAPGSPVRRTRR